MKCLTKIENPNELYYILDGVRVSGKNPNMLGNCSSLWGDCSGLWGNCSLLWGNCTRLSGDGSGLLGDLDNITQKEREAEPNINQYIKEKEEK